MWFAQYPATDQARLRNQIRSEFNDGFLELVVFTVLSALGYTVECQPKIGDNPRVPDFLAMPTIDAPRTYVESTVVYDLSNAAEARQKVIGQLLDAINKFIHPNFVFGVTRVVGNPKGQPSARRLVHQLKSMLDGLDPDDVTSNFESRGSHLPRMEFTESGLTFEIFAIPKKPEARGQTRDRSLAMGPVEVAWGGGRVDSLLDSLKDKAGRYGDLGECYVIAANAASKWEIDNLTVTEALFGREGPIFDPASRNVSWVPSGNGLYVYGGRPVNTRVSAVLIFYGLVPSNLTSCACRLFHHPWAARPLSGPITALPQAIRSHDDFKSTSGIPLGAVLGLPDGWPVLEDAS